MFFKNTIFWMYNLFCYRLYIDWSVRSFAFQNNLRYTKVQNHSHNNQHWYLRWRVKMVIWRYECWCKWFADDFNIISWLLACKYCHVYICIIRIKCIYIKRKWQSTGMHCLTSNEIFWNIIITASVIHIIIITASVIHIFVLVNETNYLWNLGLKQRQIVKI